MGIFDIIVMLLPHLWWIAILIAVFSYMLAQYYQRKVFPRVEYHRTGPNAETYPCVEVGNRVMFNTGGGFSLFQKKQKSMVTAVIRAAPEIKVFGFKTIRLHHVIEGLNETVDIRYLKEMPETFAGGALAVSEGVMATAFENMAKSIPKGRTEWMIAIMAGFLGFGWGLLVGIIFN